MSFLREFFLQLLDSNRTATLNELAQRRAADEAARGTNLKNKQWYRLVHQGLHTGFSYVCSCGVQRKFLRPFEWLRPKQCPQCADEINLLKAAGVPKGTNPADFEKYLSKLPVLAVGGQGAPRKPFVDTWEQSAEPVEWAGSDDGRTWV